MKIFRLSLFNIRKHKVETASIFFLVLLCITMLASAVSSIFGLDKIVDNTYDATGCYHNYIYMPDTAFSNDYLEFINNDERITDFSVVHAAHSMTTKYINAKGKEVSQELVFSSPETEKSLQKMILDSPYTMDEIIAKEHFIIMPYAAHDTLKYNVGDTFNMLYNEKVYPFEIAGFYESTFYSDTSNLRCVVSESDLLAMETLLDRYIFIGYETKTYDEAADFSKEFKKFVDDNAINSVAADVSSLTYKDIRFDNTMRIKLLMIIMTAMSAVVFAAIIFMILFRIKGDIDEQIVSIGVLESLGYKSGEIALSYVYEYLVISVPAVLLGLLLSLAAGPAMFRIGEIMLGHRGSEHPFNILPLFLCIIIILLIALISYCRARRIKKIPPVVAFRKGSEAHTHNKNILPLEKSKGNIHLRLAAKSYLSNMKQNFGMGACITLASVAFIVCFVFFDFIQNSRASLGPLCGVDIADVSVITTSGTDIDELRDDILKMDGVRKVIPTNTFFAETVSCSGDYSDTLTGGALNLFVYDDLDDLDNIVLSKGRMPMHDNEIVVRKIALTAIDAQVGDTITLEYGKVKADYLVCGEIDTIFTIGSTTYMTADGFRRLNPSYQHTQLDIFLNDNVSTADFKKQLNSRYGIMDKDARDSFELGADASLEERIRAEADSKISDLLELHGLSSVDYAINIDGHIITGNSSKFKITYGMSLYEYADNVLKSQLGGFKLCSEIFMVISALVIAIIVFLVVYSSVKKQRGEFGVMKGMGYTSKELMIQTSVKVIPTLVMSVILGCILAVLLADFVYKPIGGVGVVAGKLVIMAAAVVVFGFAVAFISARRIKNISVYELMQE